MEELFTKLWLFLLIGLQAEGKCKFPKEWKGRWYQSGLGEVTVKTSSISEKGICVEHHRDYYLVENRDRDPPCYQCLLMIRRHRNIIQYKESYCLPKDSLQSICSQIRVEGILYTLVREPHSSMRCPFEDAYYFNYNDQVSGLCDNAISYAKPCAGESRFRFHFKHCVEWAFLNGQDLDFECIATWKDGSDMYLYGKFSGPAVLTKDDSYRCFKYNSYGGEVYLSMSADATCRGLRSSTDGPLVMEFSKDLFGWPQASCDFPSWLTAHETWRDLGALNVFEVDSRSRGTITLNVKRRPEARTTLKTELRCRELLRHNVTTRSYVLISFSSTGCVSKHQCVLMKERANNLIEIRLGKMVEYEDAKRCTLDEEDYHEEYVIIPMTGTGSVCPYPGRYSVLYGTEDCPGDLLSGCNHTDRMGIRCTSKHHALSKIQCISSWRQGNMTKVIARRISADPADGPVGCLTFKETADSIEFSTDPVCARDVPNAFPTPFSLTLQNMPGRCDDPDPIIYQKADAAAEPGLETSVTNHETPYQHVGEKGRTTKDTKDNAALSVASAPSSSSSAIRWRTLPSTLLFLQLLCVFLLLRR